MGSALVTRTHVNAAVAGYLLRIRGSGQLASRPLRLDGFTAEEIDALLPEISEIVAPGRVHVLAGVISEANRRINAERATRYRNEIDAGANQGGFVLLVPQGQVVESSLDEPAFHVVPRGTLFRTVLAELRLALKLTSADIEGIREASRYRDAESIYGFLMSWDAATRQVSLLASHEFLGVLADSDLGGEIDEIKARLRDNWRATEILLQPGVSPGRVLDALAGAVGLDLDQGGKHVRELVRWWQAGLGGARPEALDFGRWPINVVEGPEVRWEPNLSLPPHRGWVDRDGRIEAESPGGGATLEWVVTRIAPDTSFELELLEESSQRVVARIGKTKRARRAIKWSVLTKGAEIREELRELNPAGDEEGYLFRIRLKTYAGRRWHQEDLSKPFTLMITDPIDEVIVGASPTAYHALYRFHSEQRAIAPEVAQLEDPTRIELRNVARVALRSEDGRSKEATLDVSPAMLRFEADILDHPDVPGPWIAATRIGGDGRTEAYLVPVRATQADVSPGWEQFLEVRADVFSRLSEHASVEAADLRDDTLRQAVDRYATAYSDAIMELDAYVSGVGGVPADADRLRAASYMAMDSIQIGVSEEDDEDEHPLMLISPTHPSVLAWYLGLQQLLHGWSRGRFDPGSKPPYRGLVDQFAAGPRTMVWPTPRADGTVAWWGFAGNLTSLWQCFFPLDDGAIVRSLSWEQALTRAVGLPHRVIGAGSLDARRIGSRIKKYAVLHPFVNHLRIAAVMAGDGRPLLDALKVVDEKPNTPAGAQSVRDIRYELTMIGPRSARLGRAIDEMSTNPGDDRWKKYATAIMDNPETLLAPGFAFARRPVSSSGHAGLWGGISDELKSFQDTGLHVAILGPMLTASIGSAGVAADTVSIDTNQVTARPVTTTLPAFGNSPYVGNWLLRLAQPSSVESSGAARSLTAIARVCNLAFGTSDRSQQVGLQVALAGPMSENLKRAHSIADWVIVADPLFSIEQMDHRQSATDESLLLDFSPEFDPYPGGRVVVTTNSLRELEAISGPIGKALSAGGALTAVLASISARLLLNLSNPTKQVVNGLAGLALTRTYVHETRPGALVIPIDGHEDMFVIRRAGRDGKLADLLVIWIEDGKPAFEVLESKWVGKQNLEKKVSDAVLQTRATAEIIRSEYVEYDGVDRQLRLDNLRQIVQFHLARCQRHELPIAMSLAALNRAFSDPAIRQASVSTKAVVWSPDATFGSSQAVDRDGVEVQLFAQGDIDVYARHMATWLGVSDPSAPERTAASALSELGSETTADDLLDRQESEQSEESELESSEPVDIPREGASIDGQLDEPGTNADPPQDLGEPSSAAETERAAPDVVSETTCITLGSIVGVDRPARWCPPQLSNGHLILLGGSGAGKTTALRHITEEIRRHDVPVLVLDFHGDIEAVGHEERLFTFNYEGNAAYVNPFHLDPSYGSRLTPTRLKWEFVEAWRSHYSSMGVHQINFLAELIEAAYSSSGITDDPATWRAEITFANLLDEFENSPASESVKVKIRSYMKRYREWQIFHGQSGIAIERFLEESTRLDLSQLDETARNILADVVLRRLFLIVRALGPLGSGSQGWGKFRAYVVIDEAQLLMGGTSDAKASLTKYAAEARKFGIGLIMATQLRDNVPTEIWGNIDTRLFMQALDPLERARNAKAANVSELTLQTLARGQAILTSSSQPNQRPLTIQIEPSWMGPSH
jgi:hypothetical protein